MRYTKKFIESRFNTAMEAMGIPHGPQYVDGKAQVGVAAIDHNSIYGGYQISIIFNEGGAETVLGGTGDRKTAGEFVAFLSGMIIAAETVKKNRMVAMG